MLIHSPHLIAALNAVIGTYPDVDLLSSPISLSAPYQALIHNRAALFAYRTSQPRSHSPSYAATTAHHIDTLLSYLDTIYGARIREEESRHDQSPPNKPVATFDWLWLLYKPGEVVYKQVNDVWNAFVIERVLMPNGLEQQFTGGGAGGGYCGPGAFPNSLPPGFRGGNGRSRTPPPQPQNYTIEVWSVWYSEGRMRRRFQRLSIKAFSGERTIDSLKVVPAAFFPEDWEAQGGQSMAQLQIRMGRLYWDLVQRPTYQDYDGQLLDMDEDKAGRVSCLNLSLIPFKRTSPEVNEYRTETDNVFLCVQQLSSRVIVDAEGFDLYAYQSRRSMHPHMPPPPMHPDLRRRRQRIQEDPTIDPVALPQFSPRCICAACNVDINNGPGSLQHHGNYNHHHRQQLRHEPGPFANLEKLDPRKDAPPVNEVYFLVCSPHVPALVLADRTWGHVNLANLSPVTCDTEAFKYLVLDTEVKQAVKALTGKFARQAATTPAASATASQSQDDAVVSPWPHDFVRNKGEGRIFLLHGSPGVGKTCTAECVAELTRRPLLSLTNGDLGPSTPMLEQRLSYFLTLGERYGAIVLLDEADVYLQARGTMQDLERNALVSVFLRALEYYKGVLFLTTNRVETFDPAFTSRIHVALYYRELADADRERIWTHSFDRLERDSAGKVSVTSSAKSYVFEQDGKDSEVAALRWNGREIRNALQTAVALAETEAMDEGLEKVGVADRHLKQVVKMSKGFRDFLRREKRINADK